VERTRGVDRDIAGGLAGALGIQHHVAIGDTVRRGEIHRRAGRQREHAAGGGQLDMTAVLGFDRLAVAIRLQHRAVGIEYGSRRKRQAVAGREADRAGRRAAGIDRAGDSQGAAIDRHRHAVRLDAVADHQIAALDVEAAGIEQAALRQEGVERGEIGA
ncbi:hypothetical protein DCF35_15215, partial [Listeria monocytogenes]